MVISPNKWELDTQAYLNICNITSTTPRQQLRDFAAGVNDLGLWNNMVCWPLRSTQNAGTGTTAYSLGGLGTFNGTLVNGPTWGANGIDFVAASSQRISFSRNFDPGSVGAVANIVSADSAIISSRPDGTFSTGWGIYRNFAGLGAGTVSASRAESPPVFTDSATNFYQATFMLPGETRILANQTGRLNLGAQSTAIWRFSDPGTPFPASTVPPTIGCEPGLGRLLSGVVSAVYLCELRLNNTQQTAIFNLYKQTLGTGLGLP